MVSKTNMQLEVIITKDRKYRVKTSHLINFINRKNPEIELPYPSVIQPGKLTFAKWYERHIDDVETILVHMLDALEITCLSDYTTSFDKPNIIWETAYLIYVHSSNNHSKVS